MFIGEQGSVRDTFIAASSKLAPSIFRSVSCLSSNDISSSSGGRSCSYPQHDDTDEEHTERDLGVDLDVPVEPLMWMYPPIIA